MGRRSKPARTMAPAFSLSLSPWILVALLVLAQVHITVAADHASGLDRKHNHTRRRWVEKERAVRRQLNLGLGLEALGLEADIQADPLAIFAPASTSSSASGSEAPSSSSIDSTSAVSESTSDSAKPTLAPSSAVESSSIAEPTSTSSSTVEEPITTSSEPALATTSEPAVTTSSDPTSAAPTPTSEIEATSSDSTPSTSSIEESVPVTSTAAEEPTTQNAGVDTVTSELKIKTNPCSNSNSNSSSSVTSNSNSFFHLSSFSSLLHSFPCSRKFQNCFSSCSSFLLVHWGGDRDWNLPIVFASARVIPEYGGKWERAAERERTGRLSQRQETIPPGESQGGVPSTQAASASETGEWTSNWDSAAVPVTTQSASSSAPTEQISSSAESASAWFESAATSSVGNPSSTSAAPEWTSTAPSSEVSQWASESVPTSSEVVSSAWDQSSASSYEQTSAFPSDSSSLVWTEASSSSWEAESASSFEQATSPWDSSATSTWSETTLGSEPLSTVSSLDSSATGPLTSTWSETVQVNSAQPLSSSSTWVSETSVGSLLGSETLTSLASVETWTSHPIESTSSWAASSSITLISGPGTALPTSSPPVVWSDFTLPSSAINSLESSSNTWQTSAAPLTSSDSVSSFVWSDTSLSHWSDSDAASASSTSSDLVAFGQSASLSSQDTTTGPWTGSPPSSATTAADLFPGAPISSTFTDSSMAPSAATSFANGMTASASSSLSSNLPLETAGQYYDSTSVDSQASTITTDSYGSSMSSTYSLNSGLPSSEASFLAASMSTLWDGSVTTISLDPNAEQSSSGPPPTISTPWNEAWSDSSWQSMPPISSYSPSIASDGNWFSSTTNSDSLSSFATSTAPSDARQIAYSDSTSSAATWTTSGFITPSDAVPTSTSLSTSSVSAAGWRPTSTFSDNAVSVSSITSPSNPFGPDSSPSTVLSQSSGLGAVDISSYIPPTTINSFASTSLSSFSDPLFLSQASSTANLSTSMFSMPVLIGASMTNSTYTSTSIASASSTPEPNVTSPPTNEAPATTESPSASDGVAISAGIGTSSEVPPSQPTSEVVAPPTTTLPQSDSTSNEAPVTSEATPPSTTSDVQSENPPTEVPATNESTSNADTQSTIAVPASTETPSSDTQPSTTVETPTEQPSVTEAPATESSSSPSEQPASSVEASSFSSVESSSDVVALPIPSQTSTSEASSEPSTTSDVSFTDDPSTTQASEQTFFPSTTTEEQSNPTQPPTTTDSESSTEPTSMPATTEADNATTQAPSSEPSSELTGQPSTSAEYSQPTGSPSTVDSDRPSTSDISTIEPSTSDGTTVESSTTGEVEPSGTLSGTVSPTKASESSGVPTSRPSDEESSGTANATTTPEAGSVVPTDAISSLVSVTATPSVNGSGVMTFEPSSTTTDWDSEYTSASTTYESSLSSSSDAAYTPTQTWLIGATSVAATTESWTEEESFAPETTASTGTKTSATTSVPSVASIPSSMPTLIVPANSVANNADAGTGTEKDPIQDSTLIAILLAADYYPWWFVVNSSDATSQLFNTFPTLISGALEIETPEVQTYGLQVYQPASWAGDEASLLTQYMAYIPTQYFDTLNAYIKTASSPLYGQPGIEGALAAQINTAFPLAASSESAPTSSTTTSGSSSSSRKRNIIIGVCVGVGGALWIGLIFWIYRRVKKSNDKAVHKRLSEHMSMFGDHRPMSEVYAASGWRDDSRRVSMAPSIAASDIDDRPSSFYASPFENDRSMREQQRVDRESYGNYSYSGNSHGSQGSPTTANYGPSVFGTSWFQNPHAQPGAGVPRQRASQNPFEDIATRSYLGTNGGYNGGGRSNSNSGSLTAKRRSAVGKPVSKAIISNPTLQANSLEFRDYGSTTN